MLSFLALLLLISFSFLIKLLSFSFVLFSGPQRCKNTKIVCSVINHQGVVMISLHMKRVIAPSCSTF